MDWLASLLAVLGVALWALVVLSGLVRKDDLFRDASRFSSTPDEADRRAS